MVFRPLQALLLTPFLALAVQAQEWDASKSALGWTRVDRDGSMAFYDPAARLVRAWAKDAGALGVLDVSKLPGAPEKWVMDSLGQAWVVVGNQLLYVEKGGKIGRKETLPGEVMDLAWDPKGFLLSFKTAAPYVEKRDFKSGRLLWAYGKKPGEGVSGAGFRIAVTDEGALLIMESTGFTATLVEGAKGKLNGNVVPATAAGTAPPANLDPAHLGGMGWWLGHNVLFQAVRGSAIPSVQLNGLVLVRLDISASQVDFLPTGVGEDHVLVGVTDTEAVLMPPTGGLVFVPIK